MFTSDESQPFQDEMTDECDTEYSFLSSSKNLEQKILIYIFIYILRVYLLIFLASLHFAP